MEDNLSDDVFMEKQLIINRDELRLADGQIPTMSRQNPNFDPVSGEKLEIFAPQDYQYQDTFSDRHENYFYPANAEGVSEGWKSFRIEDEEPFGPVPQTTTRPEFDATVNHKVNRCCPLF